MKYWKTALSIFALSASLALAEDFRTTKGKEYKDATVSRVEPDGIVIKFHGGIVKLPFTELPSDVQKKYEYDPVAAREYAAQRDRVIPGPTATPDANLRTSEADDAQSSVKALNPAEQWVIAQATAGEIADLSNQFPDEEDRQLSAAFLADLLMGIRPDVKLHRHGVQIKGACIDEPIDLENAKIPCEVWLDHCQFKKYVTFTNASFARAIMFYGSAFKAEVSFNTTKVEGNANFQKTIFEGPVDFTAAEFGLQLRAGEAQFQNKENPVLFNGIKVRGHAFFENAVFEGPVDFTSADVAGNFEANGAQFRNEETKADFHGMKVRGRAFLNNAVFEGPVDFSDADFAWINLSSAAWPNVHMQGMSYNYIRRVPNNERESHKALLTMVKQTAYTADIYRNLEAFFLRQGYRADADEAFIAGKRREREEYFGSGHWFRWLGSWILDVLVGYGRRPWKAGILCAVLVALGCVLFSPKKMEPQKPEDVARVYNRFWYSLGLFLPFVDLQADKVWKPKADQTFLRNYMRVHIMLGWILVPLVLAALTGLIK